MAQPVRAAATVTIGSTRIPILPLESIKYFGISVALILISVLLLEKGLIPAMERQGKLAGGSWQAESAKILGMNHSRNPATAADPVWKSAGLSFPPAKQKGHRILVMGDSFVAGDSYANLNDVWWRELARELERRGYRDVEVVGAGLSGWSTHDQLDAARKLLPVYHPDLIIWGYVTNDPDEKMVRQIGQKRVLHAAGRILLQPVIPRLNALIQERYDRKLAKLESNEKNGYDYETWELKILEGKNFEAYQKTVHALGEFVASSRIPSVAVSLPNRPSREFFEPRYRKVAPLFNAAGIPFVDTLPPFVVKYSDVATGTGTKAISFGINPADGHPGPRSTSFYAKETANFLEQHHGAVLGPRSAAGQVPAPHINDWLPPSLQVTALSPVAYRFQYPASPNDMLSMPVQHPFVQLNLENSVPLAALRLAGPHLVSAQVEITAENGENYDDGEIRALARQEGKEVAWTLTDPVFARTNTIRISATFDGNDRSLLLTLVPGSPK
jgi:hypothetical protein